LLTLSKNKMEKELEKDKQTLELDVLGMSCIGCANSIKTYLENTKGVFSVNINFSTEVAVIEHNPDTKSKDSIIADIKKLGYDVIMEDDEEAAEIARKKQLSNQRIKIGTSIILTIVITFFSMSGHFDFIKNLNIPYDITLVLLFFLSSFVIFWCGDKFLKGAVSALKNKTSDMNTLITVGVMASYIYSIIISANHLFRLNIQVLNNSHEVYYETATMIISFILIGNYLESVLKSKTQTSIKKLKELQSKVVTVIRNNEEIQISFKKVKEEDIVIIKTGDKIPVDGVIQEGYCVVDESAMTGESQLIEKKPEDKLISGTILKNGFVKMKAEKVGKDTMLSRIITLVKDASNSKPQIQRIADKVSAIFVPVVITIAIVTFLIWNLIIGAPFDRSLLYAVSVLIIACPCALGLASPMAVVIGVGRSAENGILFNNVEAIEKLNKIDTVCFDKTGTLTTGKMDIKKITVLNGYSENDFMKYVYSVEKYSNHPIAKSIENYCLNTGIDLIEDVKSLLNEEGMGLSADVNGIHINIGNEKMMESKGIKKTDSYTGDKSNLYISFNNKLAGYIEFEDKLKPESKETVTRLLNDKKSVFMISGDNEITAGKIAGDLGIKDFSFKTLPDEKEKLVSSLQNKGKNVAMIGDGINDAPSLAKANVGVAIGTGQDIAIDSADVILVKGDLRNFIKAINISHKTVSIIKQNIFWAFFYNALAIPLAAGVLSPVGIVVTPVMAAMFMAFSDVITVMVNSLRLKFVSID